ncbi:hypothetical protein PbB2_01563 [Candidatus Phycosocius bacilliformis]|uniref:Peptidase C13 family protein n=2 Tax=Candidatus Phycosocius bacilliformis TaxID=1445552 RepID=A0A2P2EA28_9PROT|nr:hypothetical protein PbB2_01563 [Candidatus Phycosocius bacilliformis]
MVTFPVQLWAQSLPFGQMNPRAVQERREKEAADKGAFIIAQPYSPAEALRQARAMSASLAGLKPERKGVVDVYVLAVGMDSDPVFGREAAEAARVLATRYDAQGRVIVLANGTGAQGGSTEPVIPDANPDHLAQALAQIGSVMNPQEDVLALFITTHGHWNTGLNYRDGDRAIGNIGPVRLARLLNDAGIENRLVILSACFSGVFLPALQNQSTIVMTAASSERPSFGCRAENDWTFFGDAFVNQALRQPVPLPDAFARAKTLITGWEVASGVAPSMPQVDLGPQAIAWMDKIDAKIPKVASPPRGTPAFSPNPGKAAGN